MRTFEITLAGANFVAILLLALAGPVFTLLNLSVSVLWLWVGLGLVVTTTLLEVMVEGLRWQLYPAYFVTGYLVAVGFVETVWLDGKTLHPLIGGLLIGVGAAGWICSLALPLAFPIFKFAALPGPAKKLGTLTFVWTDSARPEVFSKASATLPRTLVVQIWYPARAEEETITNSSNNTNSRATLRKATRHHYVPYLGDSDRVGRAMARLHHLPGFILTHLKYVPTHAKSAAPVATVEQSYPVLIFVEGLSGFRQMNTFQIEPLVSQGYIVVAIDQPGAAAEVVFADGNSIDMPSIEVIQPLIHQSTTPGPVTEVPTLNHHTFPEGIIPYFACDVSFVLDKLAELNLGQEPADAQGILTGKLALSKAGILGISLGGFVAAQACWSDTRLKACLIMDAAMPIDVVTNGLTQPTIWLTRDAATMRLEREKAGGWSEVDIEEHQSTMRAVYQSLAGDGYFVQIPGIFHANFTDVPLWTPLATQLNFTGPINGKRGHAIINEFTLAFFDKHLKNRQDRFTQLIETFPEVRFESRANPINYQQYYSVD